MHFSIHLRGDVKERIGNVVQKMVNWQSENETSQQETHRIRENIRFFDHTTAVEDLVIGGVDGSGDFPALSYEDSFIYLSTADAVAYRSSATGMEEIRVNDATVVDLTWLPGDDDKKRESLTESFSRMAGLPVREVIESSDYRHLKIKAARSAHTADELIEHLIMPHASDSGNLAIQLRSCAELGAALRLIRSDSSPRFVLYDSTLSLPFVGRKAISLFLEHLKRLCCVEARQRECGFLALSKSHGLPNGEVFDQQASLASGLSAYTAAEHWYFRIPTKVDDGWELELAAGRTLPPVGAVSYLVRFHRTVPVMRLDMDQVYWENFLRGASTAETLANETRLFQDLDFASHDQRCYGYPYPIKAAHDRASLTGDERTVLRKQVIDAAVAAGMKRVLFRSAARATGHA